MVKHFRPGLKAEVEKHVAQEDDVEGPSLRRPVEQVVLGERDHRAHLLAQLPLGPRSGEVPHQHGSRQASVDLELGVPTGSGAAEHLR
jgi:hypothetical protein